MCFQDKLHLPANAVLQLLDIRVGGKHADVLRPAAGFDEEAFAHALLKSPFSAFHAIGSRAAPSGRLVERKVEDDSQVRLDAAGRQHADAPELVGIKTAGVALIDDVGEQK